ncbi:MAG: hypothetical protein J5J00_15170 [Deltaproteobacteria bacterium]|nr:hypothetical protein [Deltaproteobacteria bacterium]
MAGSGGKKRKGAIGGQHVVPPLPEGAIEESVLSDSMAVLERAVRASFAKSRDYYVNQLVQQIKERGLGTVPHSSTKDELKWIEIESLSKLRNLVGGRFQNIKAKWSNAGFPLKEHRGDKTDNFQVEKGGWIELSNWILSQGFEARLVDDPQRCLFEIRPVVGSAKDS